MHSRIPPKVMHAAKMSSLKTIKKNHMRRKLPSGNNHTTFNITTTLKIIEEIQNFFNHQNL